MRDVVLDILAKCNFPSLAQMPHPFSLTRDYMVLIAANIIMNVKAELIKNPLSQGVTHKVRTCFYSCFITLLNKNIPYRVPMYPVQFFYLSWARGSCIHLSFFKLSHTQCLLLACRWWGDIICVLFKTKHLRVGLPHHASSSPSSSILEQRHLKMLDSSTASVVERFCESKPPWTHAGHAVWMNSKCLYIKLLELRGNMIQPN